MRKQWQRAMVIIGFIVLFLTLCTDPLLMVMAQLGGNIWSEAEKLPPPAPVVEDPSVDHGKEPAEPPSTETDQSEPPAEQPDIHPPTDQPGLGENDEPSISEPDSQPQPTDTPTQPPTSGQPVVYLTFDDGPSPHVTPQVLEILKKYQVKATFFVIGSEVERFPDLARQIKAEGHVLGNHTHSHRFDIIYQSPQHYLEDLLKGQETLRRVLQYETKLSRAPGGSLNFTREYSQLLRDEGFIYVDWNVDSGDSRSLTVPATTIVQNTLSGLKDKQQAVVLMHDMAMKTTAAEALDQIISRLLAQGAVFRTLDETTPTYQFR